MFLSDKQLMISILDRATEALQKTRKEGLTFFD